MREEARKTETGTKRDRKRERKSLVDKTNFTSLVLLSTIAVIWSRVRHTSNQHITKEKLWNKN